MIIKRLLSRFDDEGTCERCKLSWNYRDKKYVEYDEGKDASPICEKCLYEIHPLIATRYFKKMWVKRLDWPVDDDARVAFQTYLQNVYELQRETDELSELNPREGKEWMYI